MNKTNWILTISLSIIGLAVLGFVINAVIQKDTVYTPQDPYDNKRIICHDIDESNIEPLLAPSHVKIYETKTERDSGMTYKVFSDQCIFNKPTLIDETICEYVDDQGNKVTPRASYLRYECQIGYVCEKDLLVPYSPEERELIKENIRRDTESDIKKKLRDTIKDHNTGFTETQVENQVYTEFNSEEGKKHFKELLDLRFNNYFSAAACVSNTKRTSTSRNDKNSPTYSDATRLPVDIDENRQRYGTGPTVDEAKRIYPLS